MAFAYCPDCSARIYLGRRPWLGQPLICDYCDADLAVTEVNPPKLDWADADWEEEPDLELDQAAVLRS